VYASSSLDLNLKREQTLDNQNYSYTYPLLIDKSIYRLTVNGQGEFDSENGLLRIILIDQNNKEYLVYENFYTMSPSNTFTFSGSCQETCILENVRPKSLRIEGYRSGYTISSISYDNSLSGLGIQTAQLSARINQIKIQKEQAKIQNLDSQIAQKNLKWIAGETSVSKLSYADKKRLFRKQDGSIPEVLPNLQGFEYYKRGIFEIKSDTESKKPVLGSSTFRQSWDWRNVHGENWNTPARDQGAAGTCWAHAAIGTIESYINLYYNSHLDVNLSEQMFVDCGLTDDLPIGMGLGAYPACIGQNECFPGSNQCVIIQHGIPDESCDPYTGREPTSSWDPYCSTETNICSNWQERIWKTSDFHAYRLGESDGGTPYCTKRTDFPTDSEFKRDLIRYGPMESGVNSWGHAMVLVGYEADPSDGQTIWIFKNSWGINYGENGYAKVKAGFDEINFATVPIGPIVPPQDSNYLPLSFVNKITCVNKDGDGYCNWGISETKPSTCPSSCKPEKDCDDLNPNLGPFDQNMNCTQIRILPNLFLGWNKINWPNFKQEFLPVNCLQYSYVRNNYWKGQVVSYGFPIENLLGLTNLFIKCQ
jgi:hypothetical protein